jgi:outer membrane biogenesis lipoprotein LolB
MILLLVCSLVLLAACTTSAQKGMVKMRQTIVCEGAKKCELSQEFTREGDLPGSTSISVTP